MNNKGQIWAIALLIGGLIFLVLLVAGATIGWGVIKTTTDEIFPAFNDIGEVAPGINVSEYTETVLTPIGSIINNIGLIMGLIYIVGIVGLLSLSFVMRDNHNGWVIALFVFSVLLLIITCIAVSQFYEEFYVGQDELGINLRDASLVSYLIIYSPVIMTIIAFIAGIIFFTGSPEGRFNV